MIEYVGPPESGSVRPVVQPSITQDYSERAKLVFPADCRCLTDSIYDDSNSEWVFIGSALDSSS